MNQLKYIIYSLILLTYPIGLQATILHWPECLKGELFLQNKTATPQKVWLQTFDPRLNSEIEIELPQLKLVQIPILMKTKTERNSVFHQMGTKDIEAKFQCTDKSYLATSLEGGVQTFRKSDLAQQVVYIKNLFSEKNKFKIEVLNQFRQPIHTIFKLMNSNEQRKIMLLSNPDLFYVRVSAENKFAAFNLNSKGSQNAMMADVQVVPENTEGVFFEIGPRTGTGDSFTVMIKNPALIEKARLQITNPSLEKMLFAKVQKGHNNQNRNLASTTKSLWNWSVTEVTNIADIGSTACNGLPQIVDDRIDFWVKDPGRICFWTYRIKREVPAQEIATGQKIN